jgi:hypothetical protein
VSETLDPAPALDSASLPLDDERLPVDFDPPPFRGAAETFGRAVEVWLRELPVFGRVIVALWLPVELIKEWLLYGYGMQDNFQMNYRVESALGTLLTSITTPAVICAVVTRMRLGRPARFNEMLRWGWRRGAQTFRSRFLAGFATLVGLILLVVPGVLAAVWFSLLGAVIAIEGPAQGRVLTRSRELVRGRWWKLFRLASLVLLAFMILTFTFGIVLTLYDRWWVSALASFAADLELALFDVALALAYLGIVGRQQPVAAPGPTAPSTSDPLGGTAG